MLQSRQHGMRGVFGATRRNQRRAHSKRRGRLRHVTAKLVRPTDRKKTSGVTPMGEPQNSDSWNSSAIPGLLAREEILPSSEMGVRDPIQERSATPSTPPS